MNKQLILLVTGLVLTASLFFFGRTVAKKNKSEITDSKPSISAFDISKYITEVKQKLPPSQILTLGKLENSVTRGDVISQQITANNQLSAFWKDSVHLFEPYAYYLSQSAKLENSEKNLTFAAQLILENLRTETDEAKLNWKAEQAVDLFDRALKINPDNDDSKIGLGSCYIFGKGRMGKTEETMKGIQQLLSVVKKDSANMKAQLVLGIGGFVSGQYDKAIERLKKVVAFDPGNIEAVAYLADAYAVKGEKTEAIKWYQVMKRIANNPQYNAEIDERIKMLQKK